MSILFIAIIGNSNYKVIYLRSQWVAEKKQVFKFFNRGILLEFLSR